MPHDVLTNREIQRLANAVVECSHCHFRSATETIDMVGTLCEDIPGLEYLSEQDLIQLSKGVGFVINKLLPSKNR